MQLYLSQLYLSIEQHERVSADKAGNYFAAGFLLSSLLPPPTLGRSCQKLIKEKDIAYSAAKERNGHN